MGKNPGSKKGAPTPTPRIALTFKMDRSGNVYIGTAESSVDETIVVEREVPVKEDKTKENKTKESKESPVVSPAACAVARRVAGEGRRRKGGEEGGEKGGEKRLASRSASSPSCTDRRSPWSILMHRAASTACK